MNEVFFTATAATERRLCRGWLLLGFLSHNFIVVMLACFLTPLTDDAFTQLQLPVSLTPFCVSTAIEQGHLHNATSLQESSTANTQSCHNLLANGSESKRGIRHLHPHHKKHNNTCLSCDQVPHSPGGHIVGVKRSTEALTAASTLQPPV